MPAATKADAYAVAGMLDRDAEVVRLAPRFATAAEVEGLRAAIRRESALFRRVEGKFGIAPNYSVIHGVDIRGRLPEIVAFGEDRVRPLVEAFAGCRLAPIGSSPHDIRIQRFAERRQNFRWHYDGHTYNALLTLVNDVGAQTQVIASRLNRLVRCVYPPLALTPRLFSLLPRRGFTAAAGDVLLLRGEGILHRGAAGRGRGERLMVVFCFDPEGKPKRRMSRLRRRFARAINFGGM